VDGLRRGERPTPKNSRGRQSNVQPSNKEEAEVERRLLARSNLMRDRVKVRPFAGSEFGVNEFTIDANFEGTPAGRDQPRLHGRGFLNESGQPGRFRFVVSVGAVFDRYFWFHAPLL
jgi:MoaA/NifB/PqqE/SkfB family radical SAM enzyme